MVLLQHEGIALSVPAGKGNDRILSSISINKVKSTPRGSIKAFELHPDGVSFDIPARLTMTISESEMPPGVKKESLRVAVLERGAWKILDGSRYDPATSSISAPIHHFSIYGLIASPGTVSGRGTVFEVNGIAARTEDSVYGRLLVAPAFVSFYAEIDASDRTSVTITGLPLEGEHHVYVGSHDDHTLLAPLDGGEITLPLDLKGPSLVWIQPYPATIIIGGSPEEDECASYGERAGDVCTLTTDIIGDIELRGGTLDCGGHSITQPATYGGSGIGILVPPSASWAGIENCTIGSSIGYFAYGIEVYGADTVTVSDNILFDNIIGILLQGASDASITRNSISGDSLWAIALWDSSNDNDVIDNSIDVANDALVIEGLAGAPESARENRIEGNRVERGTGGVLLASCRENTIVENDVSGVASALVVAPGGWPNTVYWNNFHDWSYWGVWSDLGPLEVSDGASQGNWWGRACPGPLFIPGVDSNREDVVDSFPYGEMNGWERGISPGCLPPVPGDSDGDGVQDDIDNCPSVDNPGQENRDGVGEGDRCDVMAPPPPVIEYPADGAVLPVSAILFRGNAERRSLVIIEECREEEREGVVVNTCLEIGRGVAADSGQFAVTSREAVGLGRHVFQAKSFDAAGNASPPSSPVYMTMTEPPLPSPVIMSPIHDEILSKPLAAVSGLSSPLTSVVVLLDGFPIGEAGASSSGEFELALDEPLLDGHYTFTALFIDVEGRESPFSDPVSCTVRVISVESPILGVRGKMRIESIVDFPDPFDPAVGLSTLDVDLKVDAVKGLGGKGKNHRFEAQLSWKLRNAATGESQRTLNAGAAIIPETAPKGEPIPVPLTASWDGKDDFGHEISLDTLLDYDAEIAVVRIYTGKGSGPPCSRDEEVVTSGPGSDACLIDSVSVQQAGTVLVTAPRIPVMWVDPTSQVKFELPSEITEEFELPPEALQAALAIEEVQRQIDARHEEMLAMGPEGRDEVVSAMLKEALGDRALFQGDTSLHNPYTVDPLVTDGWRTSYVLNRAYYLRRNTCYYWEVRPVSTGAKATIHLWDTVSLWESARSSSCGTNASYTCLSFCTYDPYVPGERYYLLVIHSFDTTTQGYFDVWEGQFRPDTRIFSNIPLGGWKIHYRSPSYVTPAYAMFLDVQTVLRYGGVPDTYLYLLEGDKLVNLDDDGGVGLASRIQQNILSDKDYSFVVGTTNRIYSGSTRVIVNDAVGLPVCPYCALVENDGDGDGLGTGLERVLGTCDSRSSTIPNWNCSTVPDPADTDEDGILDGAEVLGAYEDMDGSTWLSHSVRLPQWGANPKHKDLFIEADWCASSSGIIEELDPDQYAVCTNDSDNTGGMQLLPRTIIGHGSTLGAADHFARLRADSISNPDGLPGVSLHVDTGIGIPSCRTSCGNWGEAKCIPKYLTHPDPTDPSIIEYHCKEVWETYDSKMPANRKGIFHYLMMDDDPHGGAWDVWFSGANDPNTVAHELGHTLGLEHHGDTRKPGNDALDCKPHYCSLMNYAYTWHEVCGKYSDNEFESIVFNEDSLSEKDPLRIGPSPDSATLDRLRKLFSNGTPFYYELYPNGDIDWNMDGVISNAPVKFPINLAESECGFPHEGGHWVTPDGNAANALEGVESTPAVVYHGPRYYKKYYIFYVKDDTVYYRTKSGRFPETCGRSTREVTPCVLWSAPSFIISGNIDTIAAETFTLDAGGDHIIFVYRKRGLGIQGFRMRYDASLGRHVIEVFPQIAPDPGMTTDLELETFHGKLYLAYTRMSGGRPELMIATLGRDGRWSTAAAAQNEYGMSINPVTGVGLASAETALGPEMLMAAALDTGGIWPLLRIWEYDPSDDRWHTSPARLSSFITTTKPALVFRKEPTHAFGGWYMLLFRDPPWDPATPPSKVAPRIALTGGQGNFRDVPKPHLLNWWIGLPDEFTNSLSFYVLPWSRVMGVYVSLAGPVDSNKQNFPVVLPFADGIITTSAKDNDDAGTIRAGLCFSLRGTTNSNCYPPGVRTGIWEPP